MKAHYCRFYYRHQYLPRLLTRKQDFPQKGNLTFSSSTVSKSEAISNFCCDTDNVNMSCGRTFARVERISDITSTFVGPDEICLAVNPFVSISRRL
jgi:hypothetical protein